MRNVEEETEGTRIQVAGELVLIYANVSEEEVISSGIAQSMACKG